MRIVLFAIVAVLGLAACQSAPERRNPAAEEFPGGVEVDPGLPPDRPM